MSDNIKEEFISTLSHEIRTPLTSIKGFSSTMLNSWDALSDDKKKEFLKIILEQSQRLINLVENVLNVAKIDSQEESLVLSEVDCINTIQNCINIVSVNYKDFKFNFNKPKYNLTCLADSNKIQQVLINILDNAAKYSTNSDKIDIEIYNKDDFCVFSIKNYGSFIEKDKIPHIFEKFYRIDSYIKSTTQGSGLGLYIAYNLVKNMNGKIEVVSNKENGGTTEFLIYLPIFEVEKMTKCIERKS